MASLIFFHHQGNSVFMVCNTIGIYIYYIVIYTHYLVYICIGAWTPTPPREIRAKLRFSNITGELIFEVWTDDLSPG